MDFIKKAQTTTKCDKNKVLAKTNKNRDDYKESAVKTLWNTAKILQEKYFKNYKRVFNPFMDIQFKQTITLATQKAKFYKQSQKKGK